MSEKEDLADALMQFTNYVMNERVRCYNEGLDDGKAEVAKLRAALSRYGLHEKGCGAFDHHAQCTCGFDAALANEQEGE
jgi:hypothetical protein